MTWQSARSGTWVPTEALTTIAAYYRIIANLHPDRGGSDYLAAQVNAAKSVLLDS